MNQAELLFCSTWIDSVSASGELFHRLFDHILLRSTASIMLMIQCRYYSTPNKQIMALNIRNSKTEQLAETVAELTGETKTMAVKVALEERLERIQRERSGRSLVDELNEIALRCASLPVLDDRSEDEIMGYNEDGLPS